MADTAKLRDMLQDLINDRPEQAQVNLHDYMVDKMREVAGTSSVEQVEDDTDLDIDDLDVDNTDLDLD
jgi:hypothetical protein